MAVRLGIDTGGTFTDLIGIDDATGALVVAKTPATGLAALECLCKGPEMRLAIWIWS